ncbi:MAG: HAMP domain-containing histidine kinase [bacterium]|nr:HAMP domain-containing histidine kinase [bacterium]
MNIYSKNIKIKFALFLTAVLIGIAAIWYSEDLVEKLSQEEFKKIELYAKALEEFVLSEEEDVSITLEHIIESNNTIPVMLVNEEGQILNHRNLNPGRSNDKEYLQSQLESMKEQNEPIKVELWEGYVNYVYYKESLLLTYLFYYPYVQIGVIALFIVVSYLAFSSSQRAEENQVWVGMSKETAHQLGTPLSSLLAWVELLKLKDEDTKLINEVQKDVSRLETITERFSRIGSEPELFSVNITMVLLKSVEYIKTRTSFKVEYVLNFNKNEKIIIPLNISLFEWVIENICKNAIDAMTGEGKISVEIIERRDSIYLDITDTGKGISKSKHKSVFKPGYTTKKRGWGLGLSLAKRIIEVYHSGKIFIRNSEVDKGTTFRIILKK